MKCLNCNQEINDGAKFCRYCGTPVKAADSSEALCPHCGKSVSPSAKFCKYCGGQIKADSANQPVPPNQGIPTNRDVTPPPEVPQDRGPYQFENFITWQIAPGELALKIDEREIAHYNTIKGVYIAPGTQALFFVNGRYAASLESGRYAFQNFQDLGEPDYKEKGVAAFFRNIANHIKNGVSALFGGNRSIMVDSQGNKIFYTVVLIRGAEFPLIFDYDDVLIKDIQTQIGLHVLCKIDDLNAFYNAHLVDKKFLSLQALATDGTLNASIKTMINQELADIDPLSISHNAEISNRLLSTLKTLFHNVFPYISVTQILALTCDNDELKEIRAKKGELYIADLELEQLQLRYDYMNRLQSVENTQALHEARDKADFTALDYKIAEDLALTEDEHQKFTELLEAKAILRRARTDAETMEGLLKAKQTELLSAEEYSALERAVEHRANMDETAKGHELEMATIQNTVAQQREVLRWQLEVGNTQFDNELEQKRRAAQFSDERRSTNLDFEGRRSQQQMDLLRQAQEIRNAQEQAEHQRELEKQQQQDATRIQLAERESQMTADQILARNTAGDAQSAAIALAKKYEADALAAQNDKTADLMRQHGEDLKSLLAEQMTFARDALAMQAQVSAGAVTAKQQELDRVHQDSERHQNRVVESVQTTISSVTRPYVVQQQPQPPVIQTVPVFCPNCGTQHSDNETVCKNCGEKLKKDDMHG